MAGKSRRHWLMKTEPGTYGVEDLDREPDKTTFWDGVRNYQARNLLRDDVKKGDQVLLYHSRVPPIGVVAVCRVVRAGYPDPSQFDPRSKYHDPKATEGAPRWFAVDVRLVRRLPRVVELTELKANPDLDDMMVCRRGARLSVQPVTPAEFAEVLRMAGRRP